MTTPSYWWEAQIREGFMILVSIFAVANKLWAYTLNHIAMVPNSKTNVLRHI